jgi:hypothetical protein
VTVETIRRAAAGQSPTNSGPADMPKKWRAAEAGKLAVDVISSFGVAQPKRLKGPEWELGSRMMKSAQLRCTRQASPAARRREQRVSAACRVFASMRMRVQIAAAVVFRVVRTIVG